MSATSGIHLGRHPLTTFPSLTGRFIRLEPLYDTHTAGLWRAFAGADPSLWTYLGYGPYEDEATLRSWVTAASRSLDPLFYACLDQTTGREVGWAAVLRVTPEHGVAEIGHLAFSPALQRTAGSTEVTYLLLSALFAAGCRRVEWKCDSENTQSRRAAARLGFTEEGTFRQHMVVKGHNRDTTWFSLVDDEWPEEEDAIARWLRPDNFDAAGRQLANLERLRSDARAQVTPAERMG